MKATERVVAVKSPKLPSAAGAKIRITGTAKQALGTIMCAYNSEAADIEELH